MKTILTEEHINWLRPRAVQDGEPATDEYFAQLREKTGYTLSPWHEWLLRRFGVVGFGRHLYRLLVPTPYGEIVWVNVLYGRSESLDQDLLHQSDYLEDFQGMLLIGYDPGPNTFLLDKDGAVHFWSMDDQKAYLCARSFDDLLLNMFADEEDTLYFETH